MRSKKYDQAKTIYRKAETIDPDNGELQIAWGRLYRETNRFSDAEQTFYKALRLGADESQVYVELSYLYHKEGNPAKAADMGRKAVALRPSWRWEYEDMSLFDNDKDKKEQNNLFLRNDILSDMRTLAEKVRSETESFLAFYENDYTKSFTPSRETIKQLKALGYIN